MRAYLDHNATSPLRAAARQAMLAAMDLSGNASSIHHEGRKARQLLDVSRDRLAATLGCLSSSIIFTSGGSEANTMVMSGFPGRRLIVSAIEHPSVLEAAQACGREAALVPVTAGGVIDLEALQKLLQAGPALVSVMLANNETGVIQPVRQVVELAASAGALVHCDAVQAYGKLPVNFALLGVDALTLSAHKAGGPKGVGALILRDRQDIAPLIRGGGQEGRRRAGTENLAGIAGFAATADEEKIDLSAWRDRIEASLPGIIVHGRGESRLHNTSCFSLPGARADQLLIGLDLEGCAVSAGSACSSGKLGQSSVLKAMGVTADQLSSAIRVSLGWSTTERDIDYFIAAWRRVTARLTARAA